MLGHVTYSDIIDEILDNVENSTDVSSEELDRLDISESLVSAEASRLNFNSFLHIYVDDNRARTQLAEHVGSLIGSVRRISAILMLEAWRTRTTKDAHAASRGKGDAARSFIEKTIQDRMSRYGLLDLNKVVHKQVAGWVQDRIKFGNVDNQADWPESMSDATVRRHFDIIRPKLLAYQLFGKEFFEEFPAKEILMRAAMQQSAPIGDESRADLDRQFSVLKTALAARQHEGEISAHVPGQFDDRES